MLARFANKEQQDMSSQGYHVAEVNGSNIFYKPAEVAFGEDPEIKLVKVLWMQQVVMKHIFAV